MITSSWTDTPRIPRVLVHDKRVRGWPASQWFMKAWSCWPAEAMTATIRADGTPRLSPVEPFVLDGVQWLSMLWARPSPPT